MERLAGVFFQVQPRNTDSFCATMVFDLDPAAGGQRKFELGDLIALGQIRIEIILARESGMFVHSAVEGQSGAHAHFYGTLIEYWQSAGKAEANRTNVGIGRIAKASGTTAENLGVGEELRVDFQADDHLVLGEEFGRERGFRGKFGHVETKSITEHSGKRLGQAGKIDLFNVAMMAGVGSRAKAAAGLPHSKLISCGPQIGSADQSGSRGQVRGSPARLGTACRTGW